MSYSNNVSETTRLLIEWGKGDDQALELVIPRVYDELQRMAAGYLRHEDEGHTLQASGLVHEAYFRMVDQQRVSWRNRAHFLGIAARMMRRVLVDHARRRGYSKRGGGALHVALDEVEASHIERAPDLINLDGALAELEKLDAQQAQVVELRYFGGLKVDEIAAALDISVSTVTRKWRSAKAWLYRALESSQ